MKMEKVYLKEVPKQAILFAEATVGIYRLGGQMVRLIQEGGLYYRQINKGGLQMISLEQFQSLWNRHKKFRMFQTVYLCEEPRVKIIRYHACLDGLIVAHGVKIPPDWPRVENLDFQRYAKNIPQIAEWKDLLF